MQKVHTQVTGIKVTHIGLKMKIYKPLHPYPTLAY